MNWPYALGAFVLGIFVFALILWATGILPAK